MPTYLVYGSIQFWHPMLMAVQASSEEEARRKAKKFNYNWLDTDPPDTQKEINVQITEIESEDDSPEKEAGTQEEACSEADWKTWPGERW